MPPVTILSPYSGRSVIVREQDLGRAIRDEQGRVFYVVEDPEHGRYAARTRKGSPKDLQRYREIESDVAKLDSEPTLPDPAATRAHDATGTKRRNPAGLVAAVLILGVLAALGYVYLNHPEWLGLEPPATDDEQQLDIETDAPADPSVQAAPKQPAVAAVVLARHATPPDAETTPTPTAPGLNQPGPAAAPIHTALQDADESGVPLARSSMPASMDPDPQAVIVPTPARTQKPQQPVAKQQQQQQQQQAPAAKPIAFISTAPAASTRPSRQVKYDDYRHTASGLRYKLTHLTDGASARAGNYLSIRYTAQTLDGKPLIDDASQSFILASGQAIRAFDEGLAGIREGEQLRLLVPRGHSTSGALPGIGRIPDQPFLLDVQLVSVRPGVTHIVETTGNLDRPPAMPGDTIEVHYLARVEGRDEIIDATVHRGQPMRITLGNNEVIQGLELGITGMRVGEVRQLTVPPYLAYGRHSVAGGLIPPHAVLSFRITLVKTDRPDDAE